MTVAIDHLQENGMTFSCIAYLQSNLVARGGAKDLEAVEEERKVYAELVVTLALEAREELLLQVNVGLQTI
jgi:hypothetical protein